MLKKKCPAIDTVIQYKAGAGGALLWSQANTLPADGAHVVGINLPHMVLQPMGSRPGDINCLWIEATQRAFYVAIAHAS